MDENGIISEIIQLLDKELVLYREFLELSKDKTDVIVSRKIKELETIVSFEQAYILKIGKMEEEREMLVHKFLECMGKEKLKCDQCTDNSVCEGLSKCRSSSKKTISNILSMVGSSEKSALKDHQDKLKQVVNELKNSNEVNSKLLKNSIEYVNFSINLISSIGPEDNNYGNEGQSNDSKKRSFFDVKL